MVLDSIHGGEPSTPPVVNTTSFNFEPFLTKLQSNIEKLSDLVNKQVEIVSTLVNENRRLADENSALSQRLAILENKPPMDFNDLLEAIGEQKERDEKKNNMVMSYLPNDSLTVSSPVVDPDQVLNQTDSYLVDDKSKVSQFVRDVGGDPAHIVSVFRLGQPREDNKPTPLKVICNSSWTKRALMTGQQKLRNKYAPLQAAKFFIRDDLTKRQ